VAVGKIEHSKFWARLAPWLVIGLGFARAGCLNRREWARAGAVAFCSCPISVLRASLEKMELSSNSEKPAEKTLPTCSCNVAISSGSGSRRPMVGITALPFSRCFFNPVRAHRDVKPNLHFVIRLSWLAIAVATTPTKDSRNPRMCDITAL
jgi:hypothetical protein